MCEHGCHRPGKMVTQPGLTLILQTFPCLHSQRIMTNWCSGVNVGVSFYTCTSVNHPGLYTSIFLSNVCVYDCVTHCVCVCCWLFVMDLAEIGAADGSWLTLHLCVFCSDLFGASGWMRACRSCVCLKSVHTKDVCDCVPATAAAFRLSLCLWCVSQLQKKNEHRRFPLSHYN